MEASDAGLTQDTTAAAPESPPSAPGAQPAEAQGNGYLVIVNQYEPGSIVELFRVDSDRVLRAEGGTVVDRRVVNELGEVGFSGLTPGDRFIAAGYSRGRYEEVRCVAHDESEPIDLLQPPVQESPTTIGTQATPVVAVGAAPSEGAADLGVGLPAEVSSPMLGGDSSGEPATPVRADAQVSPGDVDGVANPPAPEAGTPDASDSSGTGQANGGAVEQEHKVAAGDVTVETGDGLAAQPADAPAPDAAPAADAQPPVDDTQPSAPAPAAADAPAADAQAQPQGETPAVADAPAQADTEQH